MKGTRAERLAFLALVGGATGIGFAPVLVRLSETGPTATAFYRLLFALPLLWAWMRLDSSREPEATRRGRLTRRELWHLGLTGLLFTADLSIWHWSLQLTSVTNSTLVANIAPLFVTLGAAFFLGERITGEFLLGMTLAIGGGIQLAGASYSVSSQHLWGDLVALASAVFYAAYLLAVKQLRRTLPTPVIMAWVGLSSCLGFGLVAWLSGDVMWPATPRGWGVLIALAMISHVGGQTLIAYGFGHLPASFSSVTLLVQPVVASGVAWWILGEKLSAAQALGACVVLTGIAVAGGWGGMAWRAWRRGS